MRDIERIEPFLKKFQQVWQDRYDLRFGQLVTILAQGEWNIFNHEDDKWEKSLNKLIKEMGDKLNG